MSYLYNLGLALSQLLNTILLGDPDESFSGRLGRAKRSGRPKWWVGPLYSMNDWLWLVLTGQRKHNLASIEDDEKFDKELWKWFHQD